MQVTQSQMFRMKMMVLNFAPFFNDQNADKLQKGVFLDHLPPFDSPQVNEGHDRSPEQLFHQLGSIMPSIYTLIKLIVRFVNNTVSL
jgi:hypothetical protein